jgi:hypothetical protein
MKDKKTKAYLDKISKVRTKLDKCRVKLDNSLFEYDPMAFDSQRLPEDFPEEVNEYISNINTCFFEIDKSLKSLYEILYEIVKNKNS